MAFLTDSLTLGRRLGSVDRVLLVFAGLFAVLALTVPDQALRSLEFTGDALLFIAPFIAVSVLVAASAKASGFDRQIARAFAGGPWRAVVLAAAFGALSPFCSCGVIPLIAGLLAAGVPLAPVMAFWLASPLMDPEMFILMLPIFGTGFTVAKLIAAFSIGVVAGGATHLLSGTAMLADPLRSGTGGCGGCGAGATLESAPVVATFWRDTERRSLFVREGRSNAWFLGKWLALAFLLESLMIAYIPADLIGSALSGENWWSIPASVIFGVPAYLNGYAAIPTVHALIEMGMGPAAGLGFMIAGGATSIPAAMAVFALVRMPVFMLYVAWAFAGALVTAYSFHVVILVLAG